MCTCVIVYVNENQLTRKYAPDCHYITEAGVFAELRHRVPIFSLRYIQHWKS